MANPYAKVSPSFVDKTLEYLLSPDADKYGVPREEREKYIDAFLAETEPQREGAERQVTYAEFDGLVAISNITLLELYKELGVDVDAMLADCEVLAKQLELLPEERLQKLRDLACMIRPEFFINLGRDRILSAARKFVYFRERAFDKKHLFELDEQANKRVKNYSHIVSDKHWGTRLETWDLPVICQIFGISLKWLGSFSCPVFHRVSLVDEYLDYYFQCPQRIRGYLDEAFKGALDTIGDAEEK